MAIYLDSNIFIYAIAKNEKGEKARTILKNIISGETKAITCALTFDEITYKIWKLINDRDFAIEESKRIMRLNNLEVVNVNRTNIALSLGLMKEHKKLQPRDAIHLSSALINGCTRIVSDDSDFDNIEGIERIKIE